MKNSIIILICCIGMTSCQFFNKSTSFKEIEPIHFERFDQDLLKFDTHKFKESEATMLQKYSDLFPFYIQKLMGLGVMSPENNPEYYQKYLTQFLAGEYPAMMDTFERIVFPAIPTMEKDITTAYSHFMFHFPSKKLPKIVSFFISPMGANPMAAFSFGADTLGINWFNYLGKDFSLYESIYEGYSYMKEWNQPSYMARNLMLVEYNNLNIQTNQIQEQDELIYKMVQEGKRYYYLDKVSPETPDWVKIGYSEAQFKWCVDNELEIWAFFKENKLMFSLDNMDAKRYTLEGPTTPGMPKESPGMVGSWVGWQIVKKYVENNSKLSLIEVLKTHPKELVKGANYKPSK